MGDSKLLITGGAGYVGSHACIVFLEAGYEVAVDNLCNASREALRRGKGITRRRLSFYKLGIRYESVG